MIEAHGRDKSGDYLRQLWRRCMEQSAESEGDVEAQIIVAAYHSAEVFGLLSLMLDREGTNRALIEERLAQFGEGSRRAEGFENRLVNANFALYNHLNTLSRQFTAASKAAGNLIREVDTQVHAKVQRAGQIARSAMALRAAFPLLGLMTLVLGAQTRMLPAIRRVEERFAAGAGRAVTDWEHLLNALYRLVEMMQILVSLSDEKLQDKVHHIAASFQDEDLTPDLRVKLRNGFCRFFELAYLLASHLEQTIPG